MTESETWDAIFERLEYMKKELEKPYEGPPLLVMGPGWVVELEPGENPIERYKAELEKLGVSR